MAALTSSGVTIHDSWYVGGVKPRSIKVVDVTLVLSSQGGLTNNIPATLFGMRRILYAQAFRNTSSVIVDFGPNLTSTLVGTLLVAYARTDATDATRNTPADVTFTVRGLVFGYEA